ncbi:hypothetical protein [Acetobacter oeni]|uniref:Uncharacterized protein n=2 Tax=Acetobacter oeni TaxID=304077 RepID=A0A511XJR9_9PROT|nr:hypothetical protein [Acetobacter oeni]GEN63171.1 hypothetical protein AOE01nite_13950 [Acetobacter oeni]
MKHLLTQFSARMEKQMTSAEAIAADAQKKARAIADGFGHRLPVKQIFHRLARLLSVTERMARSIYYGESLNLPAHVYLRLVSEYRSTIRRLEEKARHEAEIYRALSKEWDDACERDFSDGALRASGSEQRGSSRKPFIFGPDRRG